MTEWKVPQAMIDQSKRIAELEAEHDALEEQRDALAAHIEDWREGIALAKDWHWERDERGYAGCKREADIFLDWLADRDQNDMPATSLDKLKHKWQNELLNTVRERELHTNNGDIRSDAEWRDGWNQCIRKLRRQVEGGE